jgi:hypothetical protein
MSKALKHGCYMGSCRKHLHAEASELYGLSWPRFDYFVELSCRIAHHSFVLYIVVQCLFSPSD